MVKKILIKLVIAIIITTIIAWVSNSLMPILGNDVALGQLQNDDAYFVAMNAWQDLQNWLGIATAIVWLVIVYLIGKDIYKEIKLYNLIKNSKENVE